MSNKSNFYKTRFLNFLLFHLEIYLKDLFQYYAWKKHQVTTNFPAHKYKYFFKPFSFSVTILYNDD